METKKDTKSAIKNLDELFKKAKKKRRIEKVKKKLKAL